MQVSLSSESLCNGPFAMPVEARAGEGEYSAEEEASWGMARLLYICKGTFFWLSLDDVFMDATWRCGPDASRLDLLLTKAKNAGAGREGGRHLRSQSHTYA